MDVEDARMGGWLKRWKVRVPRLDVEIMAVWK